MMTAPNDHGSHPDAMEFTANMAKAAEKYQEFFALLMEKQANHNNNMQAFDPMHMSGLFTKALGEVMKDPQKLAKHQLDLAGQYVKLWKNITDRMKDNSVAPLYQPAARDKRFKDDAWNANPFFDFMKQSYLLNSAWLQELVEDNETITGKDAQKLDFYVRQLNDALSPSNFVMTNPVVLKEALNSNGQTLLKGMENLLDDLKRSKHGFSVNSADLQHFAVGKNLAVTPGKVIFRNELIELIQYNPAGKTVFERPLLVIPAWINKYYILDLQQKNSFAKWLVDQGYSVFMISWVNPGKAHAKTEFQDYMTHGLLAAMEAIEQATGAKTISAMGYCLGGTLLSITLAYLKAKGQEKRIHNATFLTTLTDFSDAGELGLFVDEEQLAVVEEKMRKEGYFDAADMAAVFNVLRANDLIWSFVVNNYLLGRDPFPFDLLYWNSDGTRLPLTTHSYYLRNMYLHNNLVKPGKLVFDGVPIDLDTITTPTYFLSAKDDHIAPWESTYRITEHVKKHLTFVLTESGHVAGVVNPPGSKYKFHTCDDTTLSAKKWLAASTVEEGSWWPHWHAWNKEFAGKKVEAFVPGKGLCDAPGTYVLAG
jgi:polyhydroxyalkanoate synthase